jgi:hypothetical protein
MSLGGLKLRVHGPCVTALIKVDGREFALQDLPWDAAAKIGEAFTTAAKEAEEYAKANNIIQDQAILYRSGAPFALTNNPKMQHEAKKEAVTSRVLRRSNLRMRAGGIPSQESVGRPMVTQSPPPSPIIIPK